MGCPVHGTAAASDIVPTSEEFDTWLATDLRCYAGRREFQLDRYTVAHVATGKEFAAAMDGFRTDVAVYRKTGLLAIVPSDPSCLPDSVAELRRLGEIMVEAGLAEDAGRLIDGETIAVPIALNCPVTGIRTIYEFFPVAFCRHAATHADPLYDPSLSTPFLAINTTSDAFALAMLVADLSKRHFGCAPHQLTNRGDFDRLLNRCAGAWQGMSVNTIEGYNKVSATAERAVHLAADNRSWIAPHSDPVFAETVKEPHRHEMPVVYAQRLCRRWTAALFDGADYKPGRDGQSGGIFVAPESSAAAIDSSPLF